jgi:hypothetical protein
MTVSYFQSINDFVLFICSALTEHLCCQIVCLFKWFLQLNPYAIKDREFGLFATGTLTASRGGPSFALGSKSSARFMNEEIIQD